MSEDSMRCRRAPELAFETGDELARHKEALKVYQTALRELGDGYSHFIGTVEKRVAAVLEPPPEFEEVPLERWAVVAPSGFVEMTASSERLAEREVAEEGRYPGYQVVKLTGTAKRPVKRPVVREVEAKGRIDYRGEPYGVGDYPFGNASECHGKTGTLIFRWEE